MLTLKLTIEEAAILRTIVTSYLGDLRVEIIHTDTHEYRDMLKEQEVIVKKILEDLEAKSKKGRSVNGKLPIPQFSDRRLRPPMKRHP